MRGDAGHGVQYRNVQRSTTQYNTVPSGFVLQTAPMDGVVGPMWTDELVSRTALSRGGVTSLAARGLAVGGRAMVMERLGSPDQRPTFQPSGGPVAVSAWRGRGHARCGLAAARLPSA